MPFLYHQKQESFHYYSSPWNKLIPYALLQLLEHTLEPEVGAVIYCCLSCCFAGLLLVMY